MVVMGHRRINMMQALPDEPDGDELTIEEVSGGGGGEQQVPSITHDQTTTESSGQDSTVSSTSPSLSEPSSPQPETESHVYMVETDNFVQQEVLGFVSLCAQMPCLYKGNSKMSSHSIDTVLSLSAMFKLRGLN